MKAATVLQGRRAPVIGVAGAAVYPACAAAGCVAALPVDGGFLASGM